MSRRINPWGKFKGTWVPEWLLVRPEINSKCKLLYTLLAKHAGPNGACYPSRVRIAKSLGLSVQCVDRTLRALKKAGLIESEQRGPGQSSQYYFLCHEWMGIALSDLTTKRCQN
jgi:DNA-binding transcriptional ArsR family regulator